jgi:catechol 2,3-dioxygenase-like lactoylglutathione lyase family enzyme
MLGESKLISFAATKSPEKAKEFYQTSLGLRLVNETPFALVCDAHGTMLRIQKVRELSPAAYTVLGWEVADLHATIMQLVKTGVRFERYDGLSQDELGIWTSPDGAAVAWFKDPDGNTLSLTQSLPAQPTAGSLKKELSESLQVLRADFEGLKHFVTEIAPEGIPAQIPLTTADLNDLRAATEEIHDTADNIVFEASKIKEKLQRLG